MALQISFDDQFGSTHASAYFRILGVDVRNADSFASIYVATYVDAAARTDDKAPLQKKPHQVVDDIFTTYFAVEALDVVDQNPIERGYEYLKTLDEFDGAGDAR